MLWEDSVPTYSMMAEAAVVTRNQDTGYQDRSSDDVVRCTMAHTYPLSSGKVTQSGARRDQRRQPF